MADERGDLLTAINSFLDCSIVLPPSEVGGDELLHSVARFQREMLRKRHEQEVKLQAKEPKRPEDEGIYTQEHTRIDSSLKSHYTLVYCSQRIEVEVVVNESKHLSPCFRPCLLYSSYVFDDLLIS